MASDDGASRLRDAAASIEEVADSAPDLDLDDETLEEYEEEFGEVPSLSGILREVASTTRHLAILYEVQEEGDDGE